MSLKRYRKSILPLIPAAVLIVNYILPDANLAVEEVTEWYLDVEVWVGTGLALAGPLISYAAPNDGTT